MIGGKDINTSMARMIHSSTQPRLIAREKAERDAEAEADRVAPIPITSESLAPISVRLSTSRP